jgi:hypothetical protein
VWKKGAARVACVVKHAFHRIEQHINKNRRHRLSFLCTDAAACIIHMFHICRSLLKQSSHSQVLKRSHRFCF